jgi:hypothetical protein
MTWGSCIGTEEAFATREIIQAYRDLLEQSGSQDIGFNSLCSLQTS